MSQLGQVGEVTLASEVSKSQRSPSCSFKPISPSARLVLCPALPSARVDRGSTLQVSLTQRLLLGASFPFIPFAQAPFHQPWRLEFHH